MTESEAANYCVWLLGQQPRSEKELGDRLTKKGADEETILAALERLRGWGYLDDAALAERWVASRGKTRGKYLLRQELNRKGLDSAEALESRSDDDERTACLSVAINCAAKPTAPPRPCRSVRPLLRRSGSMPTVAVGRRSTSAYLRATCAFCQSPPEPITVQPIPGVSMSFLDKFSNKGPKDRRGGKGSDDDLVSIFDEAEAELADIERQRFIVITDDERDMGDGLLHACPLLESRVMEESSPSR